MVVVAVRLQGKLLRTARPTPSLHSELGEIIAGAEQELVDAEVVQVVMAECGAQAEIVGECVTAADLHYGTILATIIHISNGAIGGETGGELGAQASVDAEAEVVIVAATVIKVDVFQRQVTERVQSDG